jgi:hypothetical protein
MTELEELKQQIEDIKSKIAKLEIQPNEINKKWLPEFLETYFFINDYGEANAANCYGNNKDNWRYSHNNCFKTKEHAEKYLEILETKIKLKDLADKLNDGRKIDWENTRQSKYSIIYCSVDNSLNQNVSSYLKGVGQIYCLDLNFKDKAIRDIGEQELIDMIKSGV